MSLNFWNKLQKKRTFSRHSNCLRCTCIYCKYSESAFKHIDSAELFGTIENPMNHVTAWWRDQSMLQLCMLLFWLVVRALLGGSLLSQTRSSCLKLCMENNGSIVSSKCLANMHHTVGNTKPQIVIHYRQWLYRQVASWNVFSLVTWRGPRERYNIGAKPKANLKNVSHVTALLV